jgi:hypothetical protein
VIGVLSAVLDVVQIAHDTQFPHQEPVKGGGGGAPVIVILAGVAVSGLAVAGLIWLKRRVDG